MSPFALLSSPSHSDLIATGGSAAAAGELISKCGGKTLEYLFIVGLGFLNVSCEFLLRLFSAVNSSQSSESNFAWRLSECMQGDKKLDAPSYWIVEGED